MIDKKRQIWYYHFISHIFYGFKPNLENGGKIMKTTGIVRRIDELGRIKTELFLGLDENNQFIYTEKIKK